MRPTAVVRERAATHGCRRRRRFRATTAQRSGGGDYDGGGGYDGDDEHNSITDSARRVAYLTLARACKRGDRGRQQTRIVSEKKKKTRPPQNIAPPLTTRCRSLTTVVGAHWSKRAAPTTRSLRSGTRSRVLRRALRQRDRNDCKQNKTKHFIFLIVSRLKFKTRKFSAFSHSFFQRNCF